MGFKSQISHFIGSHRFLSRKLRRFQPEVSLIKISREFSLYLDPKDLYGPSYYVMYDKGAAFYHYEEELKSDIIQYLPRDGVFFDVGANIGVISFFVHKIYPEAVIYAFEPGKIVSKCIEKTLEFNKTKNFFLIKKGVSDQTGKAEFFIDPKSTGGSSLVRKHISKKNNNIESIDLVSLDNFIKETKVIPALVKVDVEGAENLVIKGSLDLIQNHKPVFIVESDTRNVLENIKNWQDTFKDYNFRVVGGKEFTSIDDLEKSARDHVGKGVFVVDYLFVPNLRIHA